ncbi:putative tail fiber protein [Bacillus phage Anath]|uniref:Putative tail fiber protein n=1 Tax=Bacillus phage Anath TaxID=2108114 RepID=A0A2P1JUJ3_9CAUD|nr:putative tail fiber protein [Bacillus phage Anath]
MSELLEFVDYEVTLDITEPYTPKERIVFQQNNVNSAHVLFNFTKKKKPIDMTSVSTVYISFKKSDDTLVYQGGATEVDKATGSYSIIFDSQVLASIGRVYAHAHFVLNNKVIETRKMFFDVEQSYMGDETIESTNAFPIIQQALTVGEKFKDKSDEDIDNIILAGEKADTALTKTNENASQITNLNKSTKERAGIITIPDGFRWKTFQVLVKKNIFGNFVNVKNINSLMPVKQGVTYYVDVNKGLDTNNGLTEATSFKSFSVAIQKADAGEILVAPGLYDRNRGWIKYSPPLSSLIVRPMYQGEIIFSTNHEGLTWVAEGTPNVYKTTRTLTYEVLDSKYYDKYGDYLGLTKRASIAEVSATPNSWYTDGTTVYVRLTDDRTPSNLVKVYVGGGNGYVAGNKKVYVEGVKFFGGDNPFEGITTAKTDTQELYFKDCEFKYGRKSDDSSNGLNIKGTSLVYSQNCIASKNQRDGFNYHVYNEVIPNAIEVDCVAYENGVQNSENNNNGSTMHDAGNIIRINGTYFSNKGPNVIDVGGCHSWNVGCVSFDSRSSTDSSDTNYLNQDGSMWLDTCVSYDSISDVVTVGAGSTFVRRTQVADGTILETSQY